MEFETYSYFSIVLVLAIVLSFYAGVFAQEYNPQEFWNEAMTEHKALKPGSDHANDIWRNLYYYNSIQNSIIENLNHHERPRILDIGTGHGSWAFFMRILFPGAKITAIDIADTLQVYWDRFGVGIDFKVADIAAHDLDLGKYDIIIAVGVMHHIVDKTRFDRAMKNIVKSLKVDGQAFIASEFKNKRKSFYKKYRSKEEYLLPLADYIVEHFFIDNHSPFPDAQNDLLIIHKRRMP